MKKLLIAVIAIGGLSALTACKKDWTCSCSGTIFGVNYSGADTTLTDMKKDDAEATCNGWDFNIDANNNQDCELK